MEFEQGNMQNNNPRFAPASGNALSDDFDLNEIFAEYFINEFEDPMNAYTSSMANYGGASIAMTQEGSVSGDQGNKQASMVNLPTGGIRTTFHTGVGNSTKPAAVAPAAPTVATNTTATAPVPLQEPSHMAKKPKIESNNSNGAVIALPLPTPIAMAHPPPAAVATPLPPPTPVAASSSAVTQLKQPGAQLPHPGAAGAVFPSPNTQAVVSGPGIMISQQQMASLMPQMQQQVAVAAAQGTAPTATAASIGVPTATGIMGGTAVAPVAVAPVPSSTTLPVVGGTSGAVTSVAAAAPSTATAQTTGVMSSGGIGTAGMAAAATTSGSAQVVGTGNHQRIALPVGVGIRLGGIGGIAPSTAQSTALRTGAPTAGGAGAAAAAAATGGLIQSNQIAAMWGGNVNNPNGAVSEQAVAERRQRNREHAKRSRVRKKFMLESLQEEVRELERENQALRLLVQENIPEHAMQIIKECCSENPLFADPDAADEKKRAQDLVGTDFSLMQSLANGQRCFTLSDPKLPDNPIVFASQGFYDLTGYTSKDVLGRNCRFLQGPGTDAKAVDVIRKAVASGADATVCLLNYKADGTPFWNQFFLAALRDSDNCIVNYVGVQTEIQPETALSSLEDKVNAVMPLQNKNEKDDEE